MNFSHTCPLSLEGGGKLSYFTFAIMFFKSQKSLKWTIKKDLVVYEKPRIRGKASDEDTADTEFLFP